MTRNCSEGARTLWNQGISTIFATRLTNRDIKRFVEEELNVKCGRILRRRNSMTYAVEFVISKPFFKKRFVSSDNNMIYMQTMSSDKLVFEAYDFKFRISDYFLFSEGDMQRWINYMTEKFGDSYEKFMMSYSE